MSRFIHDPKQRRGEETLSSVLEAAEAVYSERRTTDIPISELCERTGASRSSVYARFTNADAIIHEVYERFCTRAQQVLKDLD
ncbi:MAG: TetR family transcriptional regulator [Myxococcota bacterium]|jgi:AcrR family transcriptional regulator